MLTTVTMAETLKSERTVVATVFKYERALLEYVF